MIGNTSSYDESIYTYYGYDATHVGIYTMIEGKQEHPRGLLDHCLSQRLPLSRLPVLLDIEPRWPGRKLKPMSAMVRAAERLIKITGQPHHMIADSAFCAKASIMHLLALKDSVATISINSSTNSGMKNLYDFISQDLLVGKVYIFSYGKCVIFIDTYPC